MNQIQNINNVRNISRKFENINQSSFLNSSQILRQSVKEYYRKKNWRGLLGYLLLLDDRSQLPASYKWQIGQAYINQNRFREALDYLYNAHYQNPRQPDIQLAILSALRGLKKSEHFFPWLNKPDIRCVDRENIELCFSIIKKNNNSMILFVLYSILSERVLLGFDEFDLIIALRNENRFEITNNTCFYRFARIGIQSGWLEKSA